jgi:tRNA dimethylallyltransferase
MAKGILVVTGPTATGKTALGVRLAKALDGEVISADAMQLYRGMVIGTAAPTPEETEGIPHHLVGTVDPRESYSVGRYVQEASRCADDILARGRLPILVGGTNLYIEALLRGTDFAAAGDPALRRRLEAEYDEHGGQAMLERLGKADPARAEKLHPNDRKRIVRALEIFELTGRTITSFDEESRTAAPRYASCTVALSFEDRALLYRRIDARVERMFAQGLEEEVRALLALGVTEKDTAMQAIGYKETAAALRGECTLAEAREQICRSSRRYAKRQLSWLRGKPEVHWYLWKNETNYQEACLFSTRILENSGII